MMLRLRRSVLVSCAAALGCGEGGTAPGDQPAAPTGRLVYRVDTADSVEVWTGGADGTAPRRLLGVDRESSLMPKWAPDGRRIVYSARVPGASAEIFVYDVVSGAAPARLTNNAVYDGEPAWAPDGGRIAFRSRRDGRRDAIYVIDLATGVERRLGTDTASANWPTWSPDSRRIAFLRAGDPSPEIAVAAADGSGPPRRVAVVSSPGRLAWSPDGRRILFADVHSDSGLNVSTVDPDGDGRITRVLWADWAAATIGWSPDGRWIVFARPATGGALWVHRMRSDGTDVVPLYPGSSPDWTR